MPTSLDPQPADNEMECARCGAFFYYELTRCPNCGVNLYEPEEERPQPARRADGILSRLERFIRQLINKPYPADELFGVAINQAELFNNLLRKVGGDRATAERLIDFERRNAPTGNRALWIQNAIDRWEKDQGKTVS